MADSNVVKAPPGAWEAPPPRVAPHALAFRFVVAAGAAVMLFRALGARQYAIAALAALYNPVAPVFAFAGTVQHAVVAGTAVVFAAALVWRKERVASNG